LGLNFEIGRGSDEVSPRRVRSRRRPPSGLRDDAGLEFFGGEDERRDGRRGDAAAAWPWAVGGFRIAHARRDLLGVAPELARDPFSDDAARPGADVLRRDAGHKAPILNRDRDLGSELPEIEPIAHRDANAAAIAPGLRPLAGPPAPRLEPGRPIVETLPIGI